MSNCSPVDNEFYWEEHRGFFDPTPIPTTDGAKRITKLIEDNAIWLQGAPRTSLGILLRLFPGSVHSIKDALEVISWLNDYLWDAGYAPTEVGTNNCTWQWLEGKDQTHEV